MHKYFYARRALVDNWILFDTIGEVLDMKYVVDLSKDIVRMHLLHSLRPADVRLLVLVRDVRGFASSAVKRGDDPVIMANQWAGTYRRIGRIVRTCKDIPKLLISYEELCADPVSLRRRIAAFLNLPEPGETVVIDTHANHLVAGNPMRYQGKIEIHRDDTWKNSLSSNIVQRVKEIAAPIEKMLSPLKDGQYNG